MQIKVFHKIRYLAFFIGIVCIIFSLNYSCTMNGEWDDYYHSSSTDVRNNVLELISENSNYSSFYSLLLETGYDTLLIKNQYFTIFVPTNDAFVGLPDYTFAEWKYIIGFHICYNSVFSRDFRNTDLQSFIGKYLKIRETGDGGFGIFNANINMNSVDEHCQNGVLHEIDQVLIPKQNIYEYIMNLGDNYSIIKEYLNSMDIIYIDLSRSIRIGVDDEGNTIYDTVWAKDNAFLDNIARIDAETEYYTAVIANDEDILAALNNAEEYFGDISEMDETSYTQLLSIALSAVFFKNIFTMEELPDTMISVVGKSLTTGNLNFSSDTDLEMSNGLIHVLDGFDIPKEFFLNPIIIEADDKAGRKLSNTLYAAEIRSDSRATNGSYFYYNTKFIGDYVEYTINMVLATTYWVIWTGPALGGVYYQLSIDSVKIGPPVESYFKGNFKPVVSGSYQFEKFGTKTVRMTIDSDGSLPGYRSIFLDYIKLIPDELYQP